MRKLPLCIIITLLLALLLSCELEQGDVVSKRKLEDVLFDYHIAQAMILNLPASQRELSTSYIEAVYDKHGITAAQFDSSIVYYNRHPEDLADIYKNLKERYEKLDAQLGLLSGTHEMRTTYTSGGDTSEIWSGHQLLVLRNSPYFNRETFVLNADTAFRPNDNFRLTANVDFINEEQGERDCHVYVCLAVRTKAGFVISNLRDMTTPGDVVLQLNLSNGNEVQSLFGYFYYMGKDERRNMGVVRNISLLRFHTQPAASLSDTLTIVADSLALTDSLVVDSVSTDSSNVGNGGVRHRVPNLTPDQKRKMTIDTMRDARIKEAPSVRTPNSIGPTRRKARQTR